MLEHGADATSSSRSSNCNTNGGVLEQWGELNMEDSMELSIHLAKGALIATRHPEIQPIIRGKN